MTAMPDPYAHLKDNGWREIAEIDRRLAAGEIDEAGWHVAMAELIVPAYLAADTPWGQSGKTGSADDFDRSRDLIADAIDHDGSFLDVGCASGWLMERLPHWTKHDVEPHGLDIAPELADLARSRLPHWTDRIHVGNALQWRPDRRFTYVRTGLEYVPQARRGEFVRHLLTYADRVIVGVFNEQAHERPTEDELRGHGFEIAGRTERAHSKKPGMCYRAVWIDSPTTDSTRRSSQLT